MNTPLEEQAQRLLETLPEDATWKDLQYAFSLHQEVEAGQAAIDVGRVYTAEGVRQKFKLPPRA